VFLINQEGRIVYEGHPSGTNLEQDINDMIEGKKTGTEEPKKEDKEEPKPEKKYYSVEEKKKILAQVAKFKEDNKSLISEVKNFKQGNFVSKSINKDNSKNLNFNYFVMFMIRDKGRSRDKVDALKAKLNEFKEAMKDVVEVRTRVSFTKMLEVEPPQDHCKHCKAPISKEEAKYFCATCQIDKEPDYTFCTKCVPKAEDDDFETAPFHAHHLYWVPKNSDHMVKSMVTVKNNSEKYANPGKGMNYSCDNCSKNVTVCDWSCTHCYLKVRGSYDLCNECFALVRSENKDDHQKIKSNDEHDILTHIMIRVPYNCYVFDNEPEDL